MIELKLADNMYALRQQHNDTLQETAKKLDITVQSYSLYERGKRTPDTAVVARIARLYRVSVDDLLHRDLSLFMPEPKADEECCAIFPDEFHLPLSKAEYRMLSAYRTLPERARRQVREIIAFHKELRS